MLVEACGYLPFIHPRKSFRAGCSIALASRSGTMSVPMPHLVEWHLWSIYPLTMEGTSVAAWRPPRTASTPGLTGLVAGLEFRVLRIKKGRRRFRRWTWALPLTPWTACARAECQGREMEMRPVIGKETGGAEARGVGKPFVRRNLQGSPGRGDSDSRHVHAYTTMIPYRRQTVFMDPVSRIRQRAGR